MFSDAMPEDLIEIKHKIPVVGMAAAAGFDPGLQAINELWEGSSDFVLYVGPNPNGVFGLRITGDSMAPALINGDVIAVKMELPMTGKVCVVNHRTDGILCKKWYWRNDIVRLDSINPSGKNYKWTKAEFIAEQPLVWQLRVEALIMRTDIAAAFSEF